MKKITFLIIVAVGLILIFKMQMNNDQEKENKISVASAVSVDPISHASLILNWDGVAIYADPVEVKMFAGKPAPDIILLTDIHSDHLDSDTLKRVVNEKTVIVAPKVVAEKLPAGLLGTVFVLNNGEKIDQQGFNLEAIPMYNLPESIESFHVKGRGNGYVIEAKGKRVYISGDTSGIPEMRNLRDIDMAFVAMNLPYTMSVEEAADAVLDFQPKSVYPYHYRTPEGFSDVAKFKAIVNSRNSEIKVVQLEWYPQS